MEKFIIRHKRKKDDDASTRNQFETVTLGGELQSSSKKPVNIIIRTSQSFLMLFKPCFSGTQYSTIFFTGIQYSGVGPGVPPQYPIF
jgi:hypothetical protein